VRARRSVPEVLRITPAWRSPRVCHVVVISRSLSISQLDWDDGSPLIQEPKPETFGRLSVAM
jgi:hypothetical protein